MSRISDIIRYMEELAPANLAEDYDNVGLLIGNRGSKVNRILVCLDVSSKVVDEAVEKNVDLIVSHHPVIFKGIKRINEDDAKGSIIYKLIKNNIGVYSAHTNLDVAHGGVNNYLSSLLGLTEIRNLVGYKSEKLFIIVVFVGMGYRNAILVSTSIPLSILITFETMRLMGIDIHQISVAALIIALGMLVDNAVVVSDAIQVRIDNGEDRLKACAEGVKEVAMPVLMSTLTTVGAFLPLLLLSGMAGEFIRSVPQIDIISLSASYISSIIISPVIAYVFFKPSRDRYRRHIAMTLFENLLRGALKRKKLTVFLTLVLVAVTVWVTGILGLQFFPKADMNKILVDMQYEHGNDISKTEQLADQVAGILMQQPEVTGYTVAVGDGLPKLYYSMPPAMRARDYAQMVFTVDLGNGERFKTNEEFASYLQNILDSEIAIGTATVKLLEQGEPIGAPVRIRVLGQNQDELVSVSEEIKNILKSTDGTINVRDDYSEKNYN